MTSGIRGVFHRITNRNNDQRAESLAGSEDGQSLSRHSTSVLWSYFMTRLMIILGSIEGPYREGMKDTSFPLYRTVDTPLRRGEIYARSLLSLGNGVGLQNIVGDLGRPKAHFENGALIGDVGSIDESGSFSYCFNIFFPRNHDINRRGLPQEFTPFEPPLSVDDIVLTTNIFEPGTILASEGIAISRLPNSAS
jgi:hypothetical protein